MGIHDRVPALPSSAKINAKALISPANQGITAAEWNALVSNVNNLLGYVGNTYNVVDYGADPTGVLDCSAVINALIRTMDSPVNSLGYRVYFPPGTYRLSAPIDIVRQLDFGGDHQGGTVVLKPDLGVTAIVVHMPNDATSGTDYGVLVTNPDGGDGYNSIIRNLRIVAAHMPVWSANTAHAVGDMIAPVAGSQYFLQCTGVSSDALTGAVEPAWSTVTPSNGPIAGTTIADNHVTWTYRIQTGIWLRRAAKIRDVAVLGTNGDAVQIMASTSFTPHTNANGWEVNQLWTQSTNGNALFIEGSDVNAGYAHGVNANSFKLAGVFDESFLGNTHVGHEVASYGCQYSYRSEGPNARNLFLNCYAESGNGASKIKYPSMSIGGLNGPGFTADSTAPSIQDGQMRNLGHDTKQAGGSGGLFLGYDGGIGNAFFLFRGTNEYANLNFTYDRDRIFGNGIYGFGWANSDGATGLSIAGDRCVLNSPVKRVAVGTTIAQRGLMIGHTKILPGATLPIHDTWDIGDLVLNTSPGGASFGWACTKAGTAGTYSEGLTATANGTTALVLSGTPTAPADMINQPDFLNVGAFISVGGTTYNRIVSIVGTTVTVTNAVTTASGLAIAFSPPVFSALYANQQSTSATKTTDYTLATNDLGTTLSNSGAVAQVNFTLPAPVGGALAGPFLVETAQNLRITATGGATIRNAAAVSAANGHADNATVGGAIRLRCNPAATSWIVESIAGTWTVT